MFNTILFDLDGTLSLMDKNKFLKAYLGRMALAFHDIIEPEKFVYQVMKSSEAMVVKKDTTLTNKEFFMEHFAAALGLTSEGMWERVEEFYIKQFPQFGALTTPHPLGKKVVDLALSKGYRVGISSNAMMPRVAMEERVRWAGLDLDILSFVPSLEEMHYCKPHPGFFLEIAQRLDVSPAECLVVGNDAEEDLAAGKVGMKTFLIIPEKANAPVGATYAGTMEELFELLVASY